MSKVKLSLILLSLLFFISCTKVEKNYYPNGAIQSIIHYKGNKEHGKSVYFYNHPNTVEIEVEMRNGKRNGQFRRYFINGYLDTQCTYKDDLIEGCEIMYLANGTKTQITNYKDGKKNGPHTAFHIDGSVKIEGGFVNDMFDGDWKFYDERGVLVGEGKFENGTGSVSSYYPTGELERITHFANNQKDGKETFYTTSGQIYKEIEFKADRIINEKIDSTFVSN